MFHWHLSMYQRLTWAVRTNAFVLEMLDTNPQKRSSFSHPTITTQSTWMIQILLSHNTRQMKIISLQIQKYEQSKERKRNPSFLTSSASVPQTRIKYWTSSSCSPGRNDRPLPWVNNHSAFKLNFTMKFNPLSLLINEPTFLFC